MQLYAAQSLEFVEDCLHNRIAEKLRDSFYRRYGYNVGPSEINSWRNSLRALADVLRHAKLNELGVILEFQLPLTSKRLDCMLCGTDMNGRSSVVIVELKQWEKCEPSSAHDLVCTYVGGARRDVLHPSVQVRQYHLYLEDAHTAFYEEPNPIRLSSCAYLHNYFPVEADNLLTDKFSSTVADHPIFTADQVDALSAFLSDRLRGGDGYQVLCRVERSKYRPSKKLMDHVGNIIKDRREYVLIDEQKVVYESVLACARQGFADRRKTVIIVNGGPGTGKSVVAINLMSDLLLSGRNAQYATGSRAFTETLREAIGRRGAVQFKYFNSYMASAPNEVDVLICDEAHRIRQTSNNRFTKKDQRSDRSQIEELVDVAKVSVFFIDDKQVVRPDEIGSAHFIREHAKATGCQLLEYRLEAQFRCAGSDGFVNWVNNSLQIQETANSIWSGDANFDFQVLSSPEELDCAIREKSSQGFSARLTAGFCWPWSEPNSDGQLVSDVVVGEFRRPWNAKPDSKRLAENIPKSNLWAYDPNGLEQIGCVYTAQGFEFDYVGVIFGRDLTYNTISRQWVGDPSQSFDTVVKRSKATFTDLVKNTYRVLLSRGLKGCYVYFADQATKEYVMSRMAHVEPAMR